MKEWIKKLVTDKEGNPNEHIIAAMWGNLGLIALGAFLCYTGHVPSLTDYGIAHGSIWTAAGAGQKLSGGS